MPCFREQHWVFSANDALWGHLMRKIPALLSILTSLAIACGFPEVSVKAANSSGKFAVKDVGRTTCASFSAVRKTDGPRYQQLIGFAEGYLTAANRYEPNTFDLAPWHTVSGIGVILDGYCRTNGAVHFIAALEKMVVAMQPIRLADYSPSIDIVGSGHHVRVYQTILKRAQGVLHRQGLYAGAEDGLDSPRLREAIKTFQQREKLDPTGLPDPATLWKLLSP